MGSFPSGEENNPNNLYKAEITFAAKPKIESHSGVAEIPFPLKLPSLMPFCPHSLFCCFSPFLLQFPAKIGGWLVGSGFFCLVKCCSPLHHSKADFTGGVGDHLTCNLKHICCLLCNVMHSCTQEGAAKRWLIK